MLACDAHSGSCLPSREAQATFSEVSGRVLRAAVDEAADANTHVVPFGAVPVVDHGDDADWARNGHWSLQGHEKVGRDISARLRQRGWA